jgi:hypothetical protein
MSIDGIIKTMAVKPRVVIEVSGGEINHQLKIAALKRRMTVKEFMLTAAAAFDPELEKYVRSELTFDNFRKAIEPPTHLLKKPKN